MAKMTHGKLMQAYPALMRLGNQVLGAKTAVRLYRITKKIADVVDFQVKEEEKLIKKYGGTEIDGGAIKFETVEKREGFEEESKSMKDLEADFDVEEIEVTDDIKISVSDIALLDGIVRIGGE